MRRVGKFKDSFLLLWASPSQISVRSSWPLRSPCYSTTALNRKIIYRSRQVRKNTHFLETCYPYLERSNGKRTLVGIAHVVRIYLSKTTLLQAHDELGSDIIYLEGPGLSLIVLNSVKSVTDLLDKRSAIYSSRSALLPLFVVESGD